ncbi:unnamed protein product [Rangifer tarandus platyrhynchus]|uniref:Uncharacterized protein n=1 Tax=Rangifer tarandus platyrhynchus TaxID=3082113 RepID=A0ABN8Z3L8_RANTA|nr:unnamed protein product [Rangifer tarandus platyrhynchus]
MAAAAVARSGLGTEDTGINQTLCLRRLRLMRKKDKDTSLMAMRGSKLGMCGEVEATSPGDWCAGRSGEACRSGNVVSRKSGYLSWSEGKKGHIFRERRVGLGSRGERQTCALGTKDLWEYGPSPGPQQQQGLGVRTDEVVMVAVASPGQGLVGDCPALCPFRALFRLSHMAEL